MQSICRYLLWLDQIPLATGLTAHPMLLFIDIDSYDPLSLINLLNSTSTACHVFVIGLSSSEDLNRVIAFFKSGIQGYFLKQEVSTGLIDYVAHALVHQGFPLSPGIAQKMVHQFTGVSKDNSRPLLSSRELEILQLLVNGLSYKMIAHQLEISIETVRHHIKHMYKKMSVHSKGELFAHFMKKSS